MIKFKKIPRIGPFIKKMKAVPYMLDGLVFKGTVKIHGTNMGVMMDKEGNLTPMSRNKVLDLQDMGKDNFSFPTFVRENKEIFQSILTPDTTLYGEWYGLGINTGLGVNTLPRGFAAFSMLEDGKFKLPTFKSQPPIRNVCDAGIITFRWQADMVNSPERHFVDMMTGDIIADCPWCTLLGHPKLKGEGLVWWNEERQLWFKTKE